MLNAVYQLAVQTGRTDLVKAFINTSLLQFPEVSQFGGRCCLVGATLFRGLGSLQAAQCIRACKECTPCFTLLEPGLQPIPLPPSLLSTVLTIPASAHPHLLCYPLSPLQVTYAQYLKQLQGQDSEYTQVCTGIAHSLHEAVTLGPYAVAALLRQWPPG